MTELTEEEKKALEDKKKSQENPPAGAKKSDNGNVDDKKIDPVPYERFKEINDRANELSERLKAFEAKETDRLTEEEKQQRERLKEQEKFQELATEWEGKFNELSPAHDASQKELNKVRELLERYALAEMENVPDLYKDVVGKLPLTERLDWLTENKDKFKSEKPKGIPVTPGGSGSGDLSDDDRRGKSARTF